MKFSTKLIVSFTAVVLLLLAIGLISQYWNNEIRTRVVEVSGKTAEKLKLSGEMGILLYRSLANTQYFLEDRYRKSLTSGNEEPLKTEKAKQRVDSALQDFEQRLVAFERQLREQPVQDAESGRPAGIVHEVLSKLEEKFRIYDSLINELFELTKDDYTDGKEFFTITIEPYFRTNILPLIEELREQTQQNLDLEIAHLNDQLQKTGSKLTIATFVAFLLSIGLVYYLYRSIAAPLEKLSVAAKQIGAGNLDKRIVVNTNDEIGEVSDEFNKMAENLSKTTVSKEFMDDVIESMTEALIVTDRSRIIRRVNSSARKMLEYDKEELIGMPIENMFPKEHAEKWTGDELEEMFKGYEATLVTQKGNLVPVSLSQALLHDRNGEIQGLVCVAGDISQRKKAEKQIRNSLKEKEILLSEIHHRVKNNLAVISGLLQMQIWETEDSGAETALRDSQFRVQSIALVHEKLYQSETLSHIEFDNYIEDLVQAISSTYKDSEEISITTEVEPVALTINQAIPCSLLINELLVNAYKHGLAGDSEGRISIRFFRKEETVHLVIGDDGKGRWMEKGPEEGDESGNRTLAMSLVNTLIKQLDGNLEVARDNGARFNITFKQEEII